MVSLTTKFCQVQELLVLSGFAIQTLFLEGSLLGKEDKAFGEGHENRVRGLYIY